MLIWLMKQELMRFGFQIMEDDNLILLQQVLKQSLTLGEELSI
jgi:hypothetical protein